MFQDGDLDKLETYATKLTKKNPKSGLAWKALGAALQAGGKDAKAATIKAADLLPDDSEALRNAGVVMHELGKNDEAIDYYNRALKINPTYPEVHNNLGNLLSQIGKRHLALRHYLQALSVAPWMPEPYLNLGNNFLALGLYEQTINSYKAALQIKPDFKDANDSLIFVKDLMHGETMASLHELRKNWNAIYADHLWADSGAITHPNDPDPDRKLRIGYVSADFREHSAARAFAGMLLDYDREKFDVYCYSQNFREDDNFTKLFKANVPNWRRIIDIPDADVADLIRADAIDILVDLGAFTGGNRLTMFALKPAPIQVTAFGYVTGTGMKAMDYLFADPVVIPEEDKQHFTEEVRYLPSLIGNYMIDNFPPVSELPALGNGFITFGSMNRLMKVNTPTLALWKKVMDAVPNGRLLIKAGDLSDPDSRARIAKHFEGIAPERLILQEGTGWLGHMNAYNQIDVQLDPFPQGSGLTALESFMMGVPLVTLRGKTAPSRTASSLLTTIGMPGWIAEDEEQYVKVCVMAAENFPELADVRRQLRGVMLRSPLGDHVAYTRAVETQYLDIWQTWCKKKIDEKIIYA